MKINLVIGIVLLIIKIILAGRENIIPSKAESWISTKNFTTLIHKSFFYSKCCNIYLSEPIYNIEVLFNQFRKIYPYDYLLRRHTYECQGYFLLGATDKEIEQAMQKVPSTISTTEILVIIDGKLNNNSKLFNVSLYGNSNANIVSRSGLWTLSENYLKPRFFLKVDSYDDLMSEFELINMRGRHLQVCSFYQPPASYLTRTIKQVIDEVEEDVFLADNDKEKDGVEMQIFLLIAEKLNFTWTIRKPPGDYRYGRRVNNTWRGGCIQLLVEKKIDLAFGSIWLAESSNEFVNMSEPWYQMFLHFLVPRPQPTTNFWALTRPFSIDCWLLLIIMFFVQSTYMYTRARIDPKFPKRFRSFLSTITELMGRLLGTWIPRNTTNARFELHLWQTVGVILVTAYGSSLAARLASSEYEDRIDTIHQFIEANLSWGRVGPKPSFSDYFDLEDPYMSQLPSKFVLVQNNEMMHKLLRKGNFAILGSVLGSIFFSEADIPNDVFKNYRVMKQTVGSYYSSFAVQSWMLRPINTVILWLKESGITYYHLDNVIRRRATLNLREVLKEYDGLTTTAHVLGLTPLGAGFATLIMGLLISTLIFLYEIKQTSGLRSTREIFREIQQKQHVRELSDMREMSETK